MRATTALKLLLLLAIALLTAGCMGPDDPQAQLALACERQIEEISDEHGSDTPEAKSSADRDEAARTNQCAGQQAEESANAADAEDGAGDAEGEGQGAGAGDKPAAGDEPAAEGDGATTPVALDEESRELFAASCGGCHVLTDADTSGAVGPNLDETTMTPEDITEQIINGGGAMPAGLLEGEEAAAVGEYVAAAANK